MNRTQGILHSVEEGKAQFLTRLIPASIVLLLIFLAYDLRIYEGLTDAQSMDNAQLARQIATGQGYTTKFIRPCALEQLSLLAKTHSSSSKSTDLFSTAQHPSGVDRILPDTYNAPGYPYLLAGWFKLVKPNFDPAARDLMQTRLFGPDKFPIILNQIFLCLTAVLVFFVGLRLFDGRVAWLSVTSFLLTNLVWQYSITALSTSVLLFPLHCDHFCGDGNLLHRGSCFPKHGSLLRAGLALGLRTGFAPGRRVFDPAAPARLSHPAGDFSCRRAPAKLPDDSARCPDRRRHGGPLVLAHVPDLRQSGRFQRAVAALRDYRFRGEPDFLRPGPAQLRAVVQGHHRQGIPRLELAHPAYVESFGQQSLRPALSRIFPPQLSPGAGPGLALAAVGWRCCRGLDQ